MVIDNDLTRKTPGQGYGSAKLYILYTYIHPSTLSFWSQVNTFYHSDTPHRPHVIHSTVEIFTTSTSLQTIYHLDRRTFSILNTFRRKI